MFLALHSVATSAVRETRRSDDRKLVSRREGGALETRRRDLTRLNERPIPRIRKYFNPRALLLSRRIVIPTCFRFHGVVVHGARFVEKLVETTVTDPNGSPSGAHLLSTCHLCKLRSFTGNYAPETLAGYKKLPPVNYVFGVDTDRLFAG